MNVSQQHNFGLHVTTALSILGTVHVKPADQNGDTSTNPVDGALPADSWCQGGLYTKFPYCDITMGEKSK